MATRILGPGEQALLRRERDLLADIEVALARLDAAAEVLARLRGSVRALDELFLIAVVGEFNAGKSAFINALLDGDLLAEGVTPTTSRIHLLQFGDETARRLLDDGTELVAAPVELLRDVTIVDTPGTNALDRRHEALTRDLVPRADLVLFLTSVDRPLSESERAFLESIRQWGKKVVVLLNKRDLLRGETELAEIESYVAANVERLLGFTPPLLALSCRTAAAARAAGDAAALEASGLPAVERLLRATLHSAERLALKLGNPLGVAARLLGEQAEAAAARLALLADDIAAIDDIERQLAAYAADVEREFGLRLADLDNLLHGLEHRGVAFLDDTVRLVKVRELLNKERLRAAFEREVVGDTPQHVEGRVDALIDWLISADVNQWQAVVAHVARRRALHQDRVVGEVGGGFTVDRTRLLDTVGRAAREALARYDRSIQARRIADDVSRGVTTTALTEAGAVGLGATVAVLATSAAADVTGLLAAGTVAALGLLILPHRRRKATTELRAAITAMRTQLMDSLTERFKVEAAASQTRIRDTVAPYVRFIRAERQRLTDSSDALAALQARIAALQHDIAAATGA